MLPQTNVGEKTRRAVLKAAGAALGIATFGSAAGHPGDVQGGNNKFYGGTEGYLGDNVADASRNTELVGYHSAGGVGGAERYGQPEDAHKGALSELRVHDDLAFASVFSARGEHSQRGVAIFDISDFTRAEEAGDLERAEITLLSFVRNDNTQAACMDVKVSDDGNYIFVAKQTLTALFGEGRTTEPNTDNHGTSAGSGSLLAVDVSDPGNPEVTDEVEQSHWSVGPHNCWYHQIGGDEYVFTVHGTTGAASKTNVFRFDRATGQLQQVNAWSWDTELAQGEYGSDSNQWYHHDINVQEDPKTGRPLAYLHCWNAGLRIYDVSDPLDVQEIGVFEQEGAHHAVPAPTLVGGKRLAVTGHENPDSHYHSFIDNDHPHGETGRYQLVDCDPLDKALFDDPEKGGDPDVERVYLGCSTAYRTSDATVTTNPDPTGQTDALEEEQAATQEPRTRAPYRMYADDADPAVHVVYHGDELASELDSWVLIGRDDDGWADAPGFEEEAELAEDEEQEPGPYDGFGDFRISTHNMDMDTEGRLYAGHYHAGMRAFEVSPPVSEVDPQGEPDVVNWTLDPVAYYRVGKEVPEERTMSFDTPGDPPVHVDGLTASTPFFWTAVQRNGVVFAGCINSGPHAIYVNGEDNVNREDNDLENTDAHVVGNDVPVDVDIEREHDASVGFGDRVYSVAIRVDADEDVAVRDAIPTGWTVLEEYSDDVETVEEIEGYRQIVTLTVEDGVAEYLVRSPAATGSFTFGPVEYARLVDGEPDVDGDFGGGNSTTNRLWRKDNAAVDSVLVLDNGGLF